MAGPARPPLTTAQAREATAGLRAAMDDVRRSVAVVAAKVRDAQAVRVWAPPFPETPDTPDEPGGHGDKGHLADTDPRDWTLLGGRRSLRWPSRPGSSAGSPAAAAAGPGGPAGAPGDTRPGPFP
ncbi:hypothetical protein ACFCWG_34475 [Streptomyces sp. NPDC056390]|uniref:hypothetical protein n=1 Tax=Streptomyces sp. NPDC056390 TaxID=3345806 RepID=UPI0035D9646D